VARHRHDRAAVIVTKLYHASGTPTWLVWAWADWFYFRRGGRKAIDKVMRNKPDIFLKLLVLLVPREMKVEHTGGVKAMSDEQLEEGIEAIRSMLEARLPGDSAKVIEGKVEESTAPKPRRKQRKTDGNVVPSMGSDGEMVKE
jgi:hypothetical protein